MSIFTLKCSFWGQNRLLESKVPIGFLRKGWLSGAFESGFPEIIILKVPEEFWNHLLLPADIRIFQEIFVKRATIEFKMKAKIIIFNLFYFFPGLLSFLVLVYRVVIIFSPYIRAFVLRLRYRRVKRECIGKIIRVFKFGLNVLFVRWTEIKSKTKKIVCVPKWKFNNILYTLNRGDNKTFFRRGKEVFLSPFLKCITKSKCQHQNLFFSFGFWFQFIQQIEPKWSLYTEERLGCF